MVQIDRHISFLVLHIENIDLFEYSNDKINNLPGSITIYTPIWLLHFLITDNPIDYHRSKSLFASNMCVDTYNNKQAIHNILTDAVSFVLFK